MSRINSLTGLYGIESRCGLSATAVDERNDPVPMRAGSISFLSFLRRMSQNIFLGTGRFAT